MSVGNCVGAEDTVVNEMAPDVGDGKEEIYKKSPNHINGTAANVTYIGD